MEWQKIFPPRYQEICKIPLDIPKDELDRRIRVFGGNHFGISPTINLHGIEFRAVHPPLKPIAARGPVRQLTASVSCGPAFNSAD